MPDYKAHFLYLGLQFAGNEDATCIIREIMGLFDTINATEVLNTTSAGSDIDVFQPTGVPLAEPYMVKNNYFWFHHSHGDSMNVLVSTKFKQLTSNITELSRSVNIGHFREKKIAY